MIKDLMFSSWFRNYKKPSFYSGDRYNIGFDDSSDICSKCDGYLKDNILHYDDHVCIYCTLMHNLEMLDMPVKPTAKSMGVPFKQ